MKSIAILIPVYNHIENTKTCIQTLEKLISGKSFVRSEFKIIVTDDGSTDGTSRWLAENHPSVTVLHGDGNLWWSGAVNMGARFSINELGVDYLLVWDNDLIVADNYFAELDKLLEYMDDRTLAGSKMFLYNQGKEDLIWSFGGYFNSKKGIRNMIGYNFPDSKEFSQIREVDWLPGMGTLVPVTVIKDIGFWDEKVFPQYHGDSDFTLRAKAAGYFIKVFPQLVLWNDQTYTGLKHGGTFRGMFLSLTDRRSNSNIRKNLLFYKRHASSILAYQFLVGYYFRYIGGFLKWKFLSLFGVKK